MKGLAFALDPDGYWLEIIVRDAQHTIPTKFNLAQTMIRVKVRSAVCPDVTQREDRTSVNVSSLLCQRAVLTFG